MKATGSYSAQNAWLVVRAAVVMTPLRLWALRSIVLFAVVGWLVHLRIAGLVVYLTALIVCGLDLVRARTRRRP